MNIKTSEYLLEKLRNTPKFRDNLRLDFNLNDPNLSIHFRHELGIDLDYQLIPGVANNDSSIDYLDLRREQNEGHAYSLTAEGVEMARKSDLDSAIKKYNTAIEIDGKCVEAYVARGAANANRKMYDDAIYDLQTALKMDPNHKNAKMYLEKLLSKQRKMIKEEEFHKKSLRRGEFVLVNLNDYSQKITLR